MAGNGGSGLLTDVYLVIGKTLNEHRKRLEGEWGRERAYIFVRGGEGQGEEEQLLG